MGGRYVALGSVCAILDLFHKVLRERLMEKTSYSLPTSQLWWYLKNSVHASSKVDFIALTTSNGLRGWLSCGSSVTQYDGGGESSVVSGMQL
ncbi:hypothetical protein OGATHE_000782 [Ogataea polymorpha]|uniref:Uncharacterized protein n=1 Tax=Ogataea polymorpha TaxID=460523 RepID=A0A9P8PRY4_9ASCO|nr:hypothetical protein OGATHE_000782 [Ogataea polymorpha]